MNAKGVDVSYWQGKNIDWNKVKGSGISFVFLRACSGLRKDTTYDLNHENAGKANLLRGSYHYIYPQYDIIQQAQLFASTLLPCELPPVLDVEQDGLTEAKVRTYLNEFFRIKGVKPMIYTSAYKWHSLVGTNTPWAGSYELWVAHYTNQPAPTLPKAWSTWRFWQYTNKGRVDGYPSDIDMNYFNGDEAALLQYAGVTPTPPSPPLTLEERVAKLEERVKRLESFHP